MSQGQQLYELEGVELRPRVVEVHPVLLNDVVLGNIFRFLKVRDIKNCRLVCSKWLLSSEAQFRKRSRVRVEIHFEWYDDLNGESNMRRTLEDLEKNPGTLNDYFESYTRNVSLDSLGLYGKMPWTEMELKTFFESDKGKLIRELDLDYALVQFGTLAHQFAKISNPVSIVGENVFRNLKRLVVRNCIHSITIQLLEKVEILRLEDCTVIIDKRKTTARELRLISCEFILSVDRQRPREVLVNDFIDFEKVKSLYLYNAKKSDSESKPQFLYINMSSPPKITLKSLYLRGVDVQNWGEASWNVEYMEFGMRMRKDDDGNMGLTTQNFRMQIKEIVISYDYPNIARFLPPSIQKMTLHADLRKQNDFHFNVSQFPNLVHLHTDWYNISRFSNISSLRSIEIMPCGGDRDRIGMNPRFRPDRINCREIHKTVRKMKMNEYSLPTSKIKVEKHELDVLVVRGALEIEKLSGRLNMLPSEIVVLLLEGIYCYQYILDFVMNERISKKTLIGYLNWGERKFETSLFAPVVNMKSSCYSFQNGKGVAISRSQFDELAHF